MSPAAAAAVVVEDSLTLSPLALSSPSKAREKKVIKGVKLLPQGGIVEADLYVRSDGDDGEASVSGHPNVVLNRLAVDIVLGRDDIKTSVYTAAIWQTPMALNASNRIDVTGGVHNPLSKLLLTLVAVVVRTDGKPFTVKEYLEGTRSKYASAPIPVPSSSDTMRRPVLLGNSFDSNRTDEGDDEESDVDGEDSDDSADHLDGLARDDDDDDEEEDDWLQDDEVQQFQVDEDDDDVGGDDSSSSSSDDDDEDDDGAEKTAPSRKKTTWRSKLAAKKKKKEKVMAVTKKGSSSRKRRRE
jgi:hypothetical protein